MILDKRFTVFIENFLYRSKRSFFKFNDIKPDITVIVRKGRFAQLRN